MFTLYELKQKKCLRMAYKSPFYIRNAILLLIMGVMLFFIYVFYFRGDGASYTTVMNVLKGLNSNTFNYLESQRYFLGLGDDGDKLLGDDVPLPVFKFYQTNSLKDQFDKALNGTKGFAGGFDGLNASAKFTAQEVADAVKVYNDPNELRTSTFYSQCVRLNLPCQLKGLASKWPAIEKWNTQKGGKEYLTNLIGDHEVSAFTNVVNDKKNPLIESRSHSYQMKYKQQMTYDAFSQLQKKNPKEVNIMDKNLTNILRADIENPSFYDNIADIQSIVLFQGLHYIVKPHYERQEQIMCSIEGKTSIVLVPHIYRQELYTDELKDSMYYDKKIKEKDQPNVSPVNFFVPQVTKYPYFDGVQKFHVVLGAGDCIYIPAYFFYQMQGNNQNFSPQMFKNLTTAIKSGLGESTQYDAGNNKVSTTVSLRYMGNSQLLAGFYDAIENKVIS